MLKYSIIIITYKNSRLLLNTLDSLENQRGMEKGSYEVIVTDDGSDDNTWDVIRKRSGSYSMKYLYLERTEKSTRSRARNAGAKLAEGEFLVFLDADMIVRPDFLENLDICYSVSSDAVVIGTRLMLPNGKNGNAIEDYEQFRFDTKNHTLLEVRHFILDHFSYNLNTQKYPWLLIFSCNMAVPRRLFEKVGGFDESFRGWGFEDNDLGYRLYREGAPCVICHKIEAMHQYHPTGKQKTKECESNLDLFVSKFPDVFDGLPIKRGFDIFMVEIMTEKEREIRLKPYFVQSSGEKVEIRINQDDSLEEVMGRVDELTRRENMDIQIIDTMEDTRFAVWIQTLGKRASIPRYFPASRKLEKRNKISIMGLSARMG